MARARLICIYCSEPIRVSKDEYDHRYEMARSEIERAWHFKCLPDHAEPDSPFQAAVLKAKQAIADARRLDPEAYEAFVGIVGMALTEQRVTHGRHCPCSACAREDWTRITGPCGMHGANCPAVYAPIQTVSPTQERD